MTGTVIPCAGTGQDGDLKAGVPWPIPRFTVSGECIADKLTGLMWAQNANLPNGSRSWQGALDFVTSLNNGPGLCGHHDWRLPNRKELWSLIDHSNNPALPTGNPFVNVQPERYWSSTTLGPNAWHVDLWEGYTEIYQKSSGNFVWPVRFGQGAVFDHFIYLPLTRR